MAKTKAAKNETATTTKEVLPHGRKLGPKGALCGQCRWIDVGNEAIGNPATLGCRLVRSVLNSTPACYQFKAKGTLISKKDDDKARKATGARVQKHARKLFGDCITLGSHYLDLKTGGGMPGGKLVVFFGPEHSGKSTLLFRSIAAAMEAGIPCHVWDAEESHDVDYMKANSCDPEHPLFSPIAFDSGDDFYNYLYLHMRSLPDRDSGPPQALFVADSAAALLPSRTAEDPTKDQTAGPAIVHAIGLRKVKSMLGRKRCNLLFTNHVGQKPMSFGNPEYEKGGDALKFFSDIRIRVARRASNGEPGSGSMVPFPNFKSGDKKGLHVEKSWTGVGNDRFGYAYLDIKKNKGFSGGHEAWARICTSESGGPGRGMDLPYDLLRCFEATGQARWNQKQGRVQLRLRKPQMEASGELSFLKIEGFYKTSMRWVDFKSLVMEGGTGKTTGPNLLELWRLQMSSGWATSRFFEMEARRE
jgi:RecA/RadA recombinase